jgi:hypothetical protein
MSPSSLDKKTRPDADWSVQNGALFKVSFFYQRTGPFVNKKMFSSWEKGTPIRTLPEIL